MSGPRLPGHSFLTFLQKYAKVCRLAHQNGIGLCYNVASTGPGFLFFRREEPESD